MPSRPRSSASRVKGPSARPSSWTGQAEQAARRSRPQQAYALHLELAHALRGTAVTLTCATRGTTVPNPESKERRLGKKKEEGDE